MEQHTTEQHTMEPHTTELHATELHATVLNTTLAHTTELTWDRRGSSACQPSRRTLPRRLVAAAPPRGSAVPPRS